MCLNQTAVLQLADDAVAVKAHILRNNEERLVCDGADPAMHCISCADNEVDDAADIRFLGTLQIQNVLFCIR